MAGTPPKEYQFKPGQSGNPLGSKLHNQDIRKLKSLGTEQVAELGRLVLTRSFDEIKAMTEDPHLSALKLWMCRLILKGIKDGDVYILDTFLPWITGKLVDKIEQKYTVLVEEYKTLETLSDDELISQLEQIIQTLKDEKALVIS